MNRLAVLLISTVVLLAAVAILFQPEDRTEARGPCAEPAHARSDPLRAPQQPRPRDGRVAIQGRCVAAETGWPLPACVLRLSGENVAPGARGDAWRGPAPVSTGMDGRFDVVFEPDPEHAFTLHCIAPGRLPMRRRWTELEPGVVDLGDVTMFAGPTVTGRIVDEQGAAIGEATVSLRRDDVAELPRTSMQPQFGAVLRSEPDGTIRSATPLVPGRWRLVADDDFELVEPRSLVVGSTAAVVDTTVVLRRPPQRATISGIVVDGTGSGVAGVKVFARPSVGRHDSAWTLADGRFEIRQRRSGDGTVSLSLGESNDSVVAQRSVHDGVEWGSRGHRIVVQAARPLRLAVRVVTETGEPLQGTTVQLLRAGIDVVLDSRVTGRNGEASLAALRGAVALRLFGPNHAPVLREDIELREGVPQVRVVVARREFLTGRLRARVMFAGRPFAGRAVVLRRLRETGPRAGTPIGDDARVQTDAEGELDAVLAPAPYSIALPVEVGATPVMVPGRQIVRVVAEQTTDFTFDVDRRSMRIRVVEPNGSPSRRVFGVVGGEFRAQLQPDERGVVVIDPAPNGPVRLLTLPLGFERADYDAAVKSDPGARRRLLVRLGPFELEPGQLEAEFEARLPAHADDR